MRSKSSQRRNYEKTHDTGTRTLPINNGSFTLWGKFQTASEDHALGILKGDFSS